MHFSVRWSWIILLSADCCLSQWKKVCESIKNWFQLVYLNLSWLLYCVLLPCVYDFETSYGRWFVTTVLTLPTCPATPWNFVRIFRNDSEAIFRAFQLFAPEVKHFHHKHTKVFENHIHLVKMILI